MRMIFDGCTSDADTFKLFKGADRALINIRLVEADGAPVNMTGATATLEVYATKDRRAAAVTSLPLTVVTATAGALSFTPTIANTAFGPGTYYAFVKHVVTTGSIVTITINSVKLTLG